MCPVEFLKGDPPRIRLTWDIHDEREVAAAREIFITHLRQGWSAFAPRSKGRTVQVFEFDLELEEITLYPLVEGG